jgi:hypothetical protein
MRHQRRKSVNALCKENGFEGFMRPSATLGDLFSTQLRQNSGEIRPISCLSRSKRGLPREKDLFLGETDLFPAENEVFRDEFEVFPGEKDLFPHEKDLFVDESDMVFGEGRTGRRYAAAAKLKAPALFEI